jgi:excisionase family DNA binding protein
MSNLLQRVGSDKEIEMSENQRYRVDDLPAVMTVEECAAFLRIGRSACYASVRNGTIPSVRVGRLIRVPREALLEWLSKRDLAA